MNRLLRGAAVAVLVGGATAVLSSCSGDPGPLATETPSPTETVAMTPSPTPTVTPEEELLAQIPEVARGEDFQSATQFSRFFLERYPDLFSRDPETDLFDLLSSPECGFCTGALEDSRVTEEAGAYNAGGQFGWPDFLATGGLLDDGFWYVSQGFVMSDKTTYLADGSVHKTEQGGTGKVSLKLAFEEAGWRVHGVEFNFDDE